MFSRDHTTPTQWRSMHHTHTHVMEVRACVFEQGAAHILYGGKECVLAVCVCVCARACARARRVQWVHCITPTLMRHGQVCRANDSRHLPLLDVGAYCWLDGTVVYVVVHAVVYAVYVYAK